MSHNATLFSLVALVAFLAALGSFTGNSSVLTMAAGSLTGLFAYLQVRSGKEPHDE